MKQLLLTSLVFLHALLIVLRGYFLSQEFTVYPYLTANGLLPYKNLLDQHFPALFFGPVSLPEFITANPFPLLLVFISVLIITDIFFLLLLERHKVSQPFVWTVLFIMASVYFSGFVLWIETFVNLLLVLFMYLSFSRKKLPAFFVGFLLSQALLLRPTILPGLVLLIVGLQYPFSLWLFAGGFVGLILPLIYLQLNNLLADFYSLAITFNSQVYPKAAALLPMKREVLKLVAFSSLPLFALLKNKKYLLLLCTIMFGFMGYPRFGFEHLQPFFLLLILFWATTVKKFPLVVYPLILALFCLNLYSSIRHPYGNFFLNQDVMQASQYLNNLPEKQIYLFGAPDLLYPLAKKLPPNNVYLPSLLWYHRQVQFSQKIIDSLELYKPPILVDENFTVDGHSLKESNPIWEYIKLKYYPQDKIGAYTLYRPLAP